MAANVAASHCYKDKVRAEGAVPRARQARVGKELAGMAADLPLNMSSSVYLRVDQKHMMLWKALITGGCWALFPSLHIPAPLHSSYSVILGKKCCKY